MTPAPHPLSVLLVNDEPEEIRVVATTLREFFPGCRVEAVYTSDEALQSSLAGDWDLFLVDQTLTPCDGIAILPDLRRNNPHAAIILQSDRGDSQSAIQALRQGADFILFKASSAFLTELLSYAQEALEKRALELKLEQTFQRHLRLVESVSDVVYELDHEGRFIYVSPSITPILGYAPEELAGQHFGTLLSPTADGLARYRMNERRTGARSVRGLELGIVGKASAAGIVPKIFMQLTAKGLYDGRGRYRGTMGLLRDMSQEYRQSSKLQELEAQLREADRQLAATHQATLTSQHLQQPLSALLQDSHRLLTTLQGMRIEERLRQLARYATQASELSQEVWRSIQLKGHPIQPVSVNGELQQVISELVRERALSPGLIREQFAPALPSLAGTIHGIRDMLRILLAYALHCLSASPAGWGLVIETYALKIDGDASPSSPTLAPLPFSHHLVVVIRHNLDRGTLPPLPIMPPVSGSDFLHAHELVRRHGGTIEIRSAFTPGFQITLRFPAVFSSTAQASGDDSHTVPPPPSVPGPSQSSPRVAPSEVTDRRRFPRIPITVPVDLTIGTSTGQNAALNIGFGGILLASAPPTPSIDHQPAYLTLRTPVSFLELQGTVHRRRQPSGLDRLVIIFSALSSTEEAILLSFTQSLSEPSTLHRIEVLIADAPGRPERRWHLRVQFDSPHTVMVQPAAKTDSLTGIIVNAGGGGACIRLTDVSGQRCSPSVLTTDHPSAGACTILLSSPSLGQFSGRIAWGPIPTLSGDASHVGICFLDVTTTAEDKLNRLLAAELPTDLRSTEFAEPAGPVTSLHFLPDRHGRVIAWSHDRVSQAPPSQPVIVISPGYAQTRLEYVGLAHALAKQGYRVLRYDTTHGCGLSEGDPRFLTMQTMRDTLETVVDFAAGTWPTASIVILACDLSARIALRVAAQRRGPAMLLLLDPVLDIQSELLRLHDRDLLADMDAGTRYGVINLLGLPIDADAFLLGAANDGYLHPYSARTDLEHVSCHVCMLTTARESSPSGSPLQAASAPITEALEILGAQGRSISLPTSLSSLGSIPSERQHEAVQILLDQCASLLPHDAPTAKVTIEAMDGASTEAQYRLEREQHRTRPRESLADRTRLLKTLSAHSRSLSDVHAYLRVYDQMYQALHRAEVPSAILEVGCGHYGFARFWWLNEFSKQSSAARREPRRTIYLGLDAHVETVAAAREAFSSIQRYTGMVFSGTPSSQRTVSTAWIVAPLEPLPLNGQRFDFIVCHFALSFVANPVVLLRELYQLLRPHGTLVVSTLTPFTDLGTLYRKHLRDTQQDAFASEHRQALLDLAELHEALRCSRLAGFTPASLSELFGHVAAHPGRTFSSLEGHIMMGMVQKLDSARRT